MTPLAVGALPKMLLLPPEGLRSMPAFHVTKCRELSI